MIFIEPRCNFGKIFIKLIDCTTDALLELHIRVVSSAYITVLQLTQLGSELTNTMNKRGPKIVHCGIPMPIFLKSEKEDIFTAWYLPLK